MIGALENVAENISEVVHCKIMGNVI